MIKISLLFLFFSSYASAFMPAPPSCPGDKWLTPSITAQIPKQIAAYFTKEKSWEEHYIIANSSHIPLYLLSTKPGLCQEVKGTCKDAMLDPKTKKKLETLLRTKSGKIRITQLGQREAHRFDLNSLSWQSDVVPSINGRNGEPFEYIHQNIQVSALNILESTKDKNKYAWRSPAETAYYAEGPGRPPTIKIPPDIKYSLFFEKQNKEYEVIFTLHFGLNENYNPAKQEVNGSCENRKIDCNTVDGDDWFDYSVEIDRNLLPPGVQVEYKKFDIEGFDEPREDKIFISNSSKKELLITRMANPPRKSYDLQNSNEKYFKDFVKQYGVAPFKKILDNKVYGYYSSDFRGMDWSLESSITNIEEPAIIFGINILKKSGDYRPKDVTLPTLQIFNLVTLHENKLFTIPLKIKYSLNDNYVPDLRKQRTMTCETQLKLERK